VKHLRSETAEAGWSLLCAEIMEAAQCWHAGAPSKDNEQRLELLLDIFREWTYRLLIKTKTRPHGLGGDSRSTKEPVAIECEQIKAERILATISCVSTARSAVVQSNYSTVFDRLILRKLSQTDGATPWSGVQCPCKYPVFVQVICPAGSKRQPITDALGIAVLEAAMGALRRVPRLHFAKDGEGVRGCAAAFMEENWLGQLLGTAEDSRRV
jgi:hypothetical protein